ncbi:hypothetical protein [Cupriavidus pinatubonensis]|uniref:hypothetical protein n=1 Tax=Cupriavidus pinatubonensis TaxID=248026 RepID=UPI002159F19B|nr:hypothetical protein [Cupriavidus pinatubonensis]
MKNTSDSFPGESAQMIKARRLRLTTSLMGPELSESEYVKQALAQSSLFSLIPGIAGPYVADALVWERIRYYYVHALDYSGARRLVEVFVVNEQRLLEPVLAFQYPPPFRTLFPEDYALLHRDDLQEEATSD